MANIEEKHNNNSIDYKIAKNNLDTNNNDNEPLSFPIALSRFFWEEKTEKSVTSFFEEYQNYLNNIYYQNSPKKLSEIKFIESDQFFKEDNIIRFLREYKGYKNTTFNNRLGLFRRIIRVILKNPVWDYVFYSFKEKKTKNEKLLSPSQKVILLNKIDNQKSKDLVILFELVFDLGYSVYQVSKMKVKDIFFNQNIIEILYKGKGKIRQ